MGRGRGVLVPHSVGREPQGTPCPVPAPCPALTLQEAARGLHSSHQDINKLLGHKAPKSPFTPSKSRWGHRDPGGHPDTSLCPPKGAQRLAAASLHRTAQRGLDHDGFIGCLDPKGTPPMLLGEFWEGDQTLPGATAGV